MPGWPAELDVMWLFPDAQREAELGLRQELETLNAVPLALPHAVPPEQEKGRFLR